MESNDKLLGGAGTQLIVGAGVHAVKTGCAAYCAKVRVDATKITSISENAISGASPIVVTDESWENVTTLLKDDYISFANPITSISLDGANDSVMLYLIPLRKA